MSLYSALQASCAKDHTINSALYDLSQERQKIVNAFMSAVKDAYKIERAYNLGLRLFNNDVLAAEGASYVAIDFRWKSRCICYDDRLKIQVIEIRRDQDGELYAADRQTGESLGPVDDESFHPQLFSDRKNWSAPERLLPLDGPIVSRHRLAARLAKIAKMAINGDARISRIHAIDQETEKLLDDRDNLKKATLSLPRKILGTRLDDLNAANPNLVHAMKTMDWTHHYADRHIASAAKQEETIKASLHAMTLDEAAGFFVEHCQIYWTYLRSYLFHHPQNVHEKAAAAA